MIYTELELRTTTKAAARFRSSIEELSQIPDEAIENKKSLQSHIRAMRLQAEELEAEISEYELIKFGKVDYRVTAATDLGINLVKARIQSGMDRTTLAKHLNVNEDQILQNEAMRYEITPVAEIRKTAKILNVRIPEEVIPPTFNGKMSSILTKLKKVGLDQKFVLSRLIKPNSYVKVSHLSGTELDKYTFGLIKHLHHIFGWTCDHLLKSNELSAPISNSASVKFKVESNRDSNKINVYSMYARYLAEVLTANVKNLIKKDIPVDALLMRKAIIESYGSVNLENTLNYAWDCGVIILPLDVKGNFHGACMRIKGRNVIILNPRKRFVATWLFDLLHELSHAGQEPNKESFDEVEELATSFERRTSKEEIDANDFANVVIFGRKAKKLLNQCLEQADGNLNLLKNTIVQIAEENRVMVGALANYVTHESKTNSKYTYKELLVMAESLQLEEGNPYEMARNSFIKRCQLKTMSGTDIALLFQAIEDV